MCVCVFTANARDFNFLWNVVLNCMMLKSKQGFRSLGQMECTMVDPCALLWHLCATSHGFSDFMEDEMEITPPIQRQPWSIVLYSDEVSPGNQLKADNRRG